MQYLAGAGAGCLSLDDSDHVEKSKLHRQPLYRMADVGAPKVQTAATALRV